MESRVRDRRAHASLMLEAHEQEDGDERVLVLSDAFRAAARAAHRPIRERRAGKTFHRRPVVLKHAGPALHVGPGWSVQNGRRRRMSAST